MSDLLITELDTTLSQKVTPTATMIVAAIRPHIYIQNDPAGSLRVDIYDSTNTTLLKSSETITVASIKSQALITDDYFHGYIRFLIDWGLVKDTQYTIRLEGVSGYTFSTTDHIAWCKDFDLRKYSASYTPNVGFNSSFDLELWEQNDNLRAL